MPSVDQSALLTPADVMAALPGKWRDDPLEGWPNRITLDLCADLRLHVRMMTPETHAAKVRHAARYGYETGPLMIWVDVETDWRDAAPWASGHATTIPEVVELAARKVSRAILFGEPVDALPAWLGPPVAEMLERAADHARDAAQRVRETTLEGENRVQH